MALGRPTIDNRQCSGDESLGRNRGAMFFLSGVNAGEDAVPPKLPESLNFDFGEASIYFPENRF